MSTFATSHGFGPAETPAHVTAGFGNGSLAGFPLFEGLDAAALRHIDSACRWIHCDAGQLIVDPRDGRRDVFLVVAGRVRVENETASGGSVVHAELGAGEIFGELAALGDQPRTASVYALEDTVLASLPPDELIAIARDNGIVALRLLKRLAHIIGDCGVQIGQLS